MALFTLLRSGIKVAALLTTVTREYDRISMHGVRRALLAKQARSLGQKLEEVFISPGASNEEYELQIEAMLSGYKEAGVTSVVFGDIFLEDLRKYREDRLHTLGMTALFPIWKTGTRDLARRFIETGFKAVTTCVDTRVLGGEFVGREIDLQFLADLPPSVDPCGENGEYHSFVYDGPIFQEPMKVRTGERVLRDERFLFCDLVEGSSP